MKSGRRIFSFAVLGIALLSPQVALPADDPVPKFEKLLLEAEAATNSVSPIYFNKHKQAWAKRMFKASDIQFDVKKTDSLVSPIVGLVSFKLVTGQTELMPTQQEAERETSVSPKSITPHRISLTYSYKESRWVFLKGTSETLAPGLQGKLFELTEDKIRKEPDAIPNAALLYWLPK